MSAEEALLRHRPGFERPTDAVNLLFKKINRVGTDSATPTLPAQRYPTLRGRVENSRPARSEIRDRLPRFAV
jgi:hypothetical protein